jgi:putative flippase GtrA
MTIAGVRRETWGQLIRYAVNGGLVTILYDIVYVGVERLTAASVQVANLIGYIAAVLTGYVLHSRVTFKDHGERNRGTQIRFVLASLLSYAINAFWTWLFAQHWQLHPEAPLIPISTVTPLVLFAVNRWWVFR